MTPATITIPDEDLDTDPFETAVDDVADIIIKTRATTSHRLWDADRFHDMLRERLLAEERLH